jgi:2-ketocyclohexanecarboxyl-CoA hydrolase
MSFETILYREEGPVGWLTLNRPDDGNMFTPQMCHDIRDCIDAIRRETRTRVLVITGAGDRAFCAGGDVRWLQEVQQGGQGGQAAPMDPHAGIEDFLKPVIARVNGYSIGGGNHLAYFSDFTIASERATFAQVGPRVGSPAAGHWVSYLTHVVGAKKAKEIWMLCRRYSAQEALEMGLVNAVVPHEKLDEEVDRWCTELMQKSPSCLKILKASFREVFQPLRQPDRNWVRELAPDFFQTGEADEGKDAFLERREPDFSRFPR